MENITEIALAIFASTGFWAFCQFLVQRYFDRKSTVKAALLGRPRDRGEVLEALRRVPGAARFLDPANASWAPEQDFWLCAGIGRCPFVMRAEERLPSGEFVFRAVPVTA